MNRTKGHWPKGRRRNPEHGLPPLVAALRRILRHTIPRLISRRAIAREIDVSPRTLARWLAGEDYPSIPHRRRLAVWLRSHHAL